MLTGTGLLFLPGPENRTSDGGKCLLAALLREHTARQLIAAPDSLWVPCEEMRSVNLRRKIPVHAELRLFDGTVYELKEAIYGEPMGNSRDLLNPMLASYAREGSPAD